MFMTLEESNTLCIDICSLHYDKSIHSYSIHILVYMFNIYIFLLLWIHMKAYMVHHMIYIIMASVIVMDSLYDGL
jgi:hypothetical protein